MVVGCALLGAALIQPVVDRPASPGVARTATPSIEIRARFSGIAPGGQTTGFSVAPDGTLAVVDRSRQRVVRLDATGAPLAEWGPRFESDADAQDLNGIVAAGNNDWYVVDRGRERILHLDANGRAIHSIDLQPLGTYGPNGLAMDAQGDVYLADTGSNRILVFSSSGALLRTIGTAGAGLGQLKQPMALSFGPDGGLVVTDFENNRIERWDASLQPTNTWPLTGHAWGVVVDGLDRVFVPDADHNLVRMFSPYGDVLAEIGAQPAAALGIGAPTQVGLAPDGSALWVLGNDGLAHVDLTPYSQLVPTVRGPATTPLPLAAAGAVLAVLGLVPLVWSAVASGTAQAPVPVGEAALGLDASPLVVRRSSGELLTTRRARMALAAGMTLFTLGGAGVVLAQVALGSQSGRDAPWVTLALEIVAGLVWALGCAISARALPIAWVMDWPGVRAESRWPTFTGPRTVLVALAVVLGGLAGGLWYAGRFETPEATRSMLVWLLAVVLAGSACARWGFRRRRWRLMLVLLLLFLAALPPRLWQVSDVPYGIWYDEAQGAVEVRRVVDQGTYAPILNTYGRDTSGFFYLVAGLSAVLSDKVVAARAAAALVGALTAPATYLLGRELFGWRVGLAAGIVLAGMRWHINFSRLGFNPIALTLCATLAFWLLARAVRRKHWSDMAWAGLALGVGLHAYTGFRGMPVVAGVALFGAALMQRWPLRSLVPRVGVYVGGAVLTALPVIVFAVQDPISFNGRTAQTLILTQPVADAEKLRQIWENVQRHALMFNVSGDLNGRHNLPGAPMLDPLTGGLVVLGLSWLLLRPLNWRTLLLLAWSAVAMSGGILTLAFEAPQGVRTFGVTPVLAVLAGVGLVATLDRLIAVVTLPHAVRAWRATVAVAALGTLVVACIGFTNLDTFFNRQMRDADVFGSFSTRETVPARAALTSGGHYTSILASTTMTPSIEAAFLVPDLQATIRQFDPGGDLPYRGRGPGLIFLETEHDQGLIDAVARLYPDAIRQPVRPPDGGKAIVEGFRLEPDVLAARRGVQATYGRADGTREARTEPRPEFDPATPDLPVSLPAQVTWTGALALETTGEYALRVPPGFTLQIDEEILPLAAGRGVLLRLVRGNHALRVVGTLQPGVPARLEWRPQGVAEWQAVPPDALFQPPEGGLGLRLVLSPGLDPASQPPEEYVDPVLAHYYHVSPFARLHLDPREWSAEWVGQLEAPDTGKYRFVLDHSQAATVWLDGQAVLGNVVGTADTRDATLDLERGRHAIRVRYEKAVDGSPWINLFWTPPGAPPSLIPGGALFAPPPVVLGSAP